MQPIDLFGSTSIKKTFEIYRFGSILVTASEKLIDGVSAAAMTKSEVNSELEALERSDATLTQLVDHAARLLSLDLPAYDKATGNLPQTVRGNARYTFKEQWVLRWLIRRLASIQSEKKNNAKANTSANQVLDDRVWLLLLHLLRTIPSQVLTEILLERKFTAHLGDIVRLSLDIKSQRPLADDHKAADVNQKLSGERPSKRRRLSPEPPDPSIIGNLHCLILKVCTICTELGNNKDDAGQELIVPLWSSFDAYAAFASSSMALAVHVMEQGRNAELAAASISSIIDSLSSWQSSADGNPKSSNSQVFNRSCLALCLELGELLDNHRSTAFKVAKSAVEACIARFTVLSLRNRYLKTHAKRWSSQGGCIIWSHIEPFVSEVKEQLCVATYPGLAARADYLFDIAIRIIPKYDNRTKSQEQSWLDVLLLSSAYLTCPALPQLTLQDDAIKVMDAVIDRTLLDNPSTLTRLLQSAASATYVPSLEVASYLAAAVAAFQELENPWMPLASLMQIESNAFMPDVRLPTSGFALRQILLRIERSNVSHDEYEVLRDRVVIPLLQSYAASRALLEFISIWRTQLQEAMRVLQSNSSARGTAVRVWADDDVFEEFRRQTTSSTSTAARDTILPALLPTLTDLSTRKPPFLDCFATIAIATTLLEETSASSSAFDNESYDEILQVLSIMIQRPSDYQGQRWRLWKLASALQLRDTSLRLPEELLSEASASASLANTEEKAHSVHWNQECLSRFMVLGNEISEGAESYTKAFGTELKHLENLVKHSVKASDSATDDKEWDGRSLTISSPGQLVTACLGVIAAHPKLLDHNADFAAAMLNLSVQGSSRSAQLQEGNATGVSKLVQELARLFTDMFPAILSKELAIVHTTLKNSSTTAALQQCINLNHIALATIRASQLKSHAEKQFTLLQNLDHMTDVLSDVAEILTFVNWIGASTTTAYVRADSWTEWRHISDQVAKSKIDGCNTDFLVVSRAVQVGVGRLLKCITATSLENDNVLDSVVQHNIKALRSMSKSGRRVRLSEHLFEVHSASWMLSNNGSLSARSHAAFTEMQGLLATAVTDDIHALSVSDFEDQVSPKAAIIVGLAMQLLKNGSESKDFGNAARGLSASVAYKINELPPGNPQFTELQNLILDQYNQLASVSPAAIALSEAPEQMPSLPSEALLVVEHGSWLDYDAAASKVQTFVSQLPSRDYSRCLELCATTVDRPHGFADQFIIGTIIRRLSAEDFEEDQKISTTFNAIASLSSESSVSGVVALLRLENANLALTMHPQQIGQATIDKLLAQLCNYGRSGITSELNANFQPHLIVDRTMFIIGTLLSRFRRRLADRHHILLPILQHLLRCFFYSPEVERRARQATVSGSNPDSLLRSLPAWLKNSKSTLPPSSATNFSRLLSSICNPTVSAARSSRGAGKKDSKLTDETKRVKTIAGQHMQYLVTDYCRCTLDGDITSEVKEKLLPGMYAVLDAMSRDLMQSMNANMDPSSRAIFKTLYDDWVKYGKWDKS